jgi:hypothetical protein
VSIFDLLFILVFLAAAATILRAAFLAIRGPRARALSLLRRLSLSAGVYLSVVVLASIFWPRTILKMGGPRCFDDWCITVESAARRPAGGRGAYLVAFRLSSTARGVSQRENSLAVYITDDRNRRYNPVPHNTDVPFNIQLGPQESVTVTRVFELPADAHEPGLVITHEGGFPIGWFIVGYETWFRKPAIVPLGVGLQPARGFSPASGTRQ